MKPSDLITKRDLNEFQKELLQAMEEKIGNLIAETALKKRWLRTEEVANYLSLSKSQVNVLKNEGILKASKLGGTNFFNRQEIDEYLENQV